MKMSANTEVLEPEVLPPGTGEPKVAETNMPGGFSPIIAGLLIDLVNIPLAGFPGFIVGGAIGYYACKYNRVPLAQTLVIAIATGWYCGLPLPRTFPLATMVGLTIYLWRRFGR